MIPGITKEEWDKSQGLEIKGWIRKAPKGEPHVIARYLKKFFVKHLIDFSDKVVVDICSGPAGVLTQIDCKYGIGIDSLMDSYRGHYPLDKFVPIVSICEDIPLLNHYADAVFCTNALDHVWNAEAVWTEMQRILKPGGRLYLMVDLRTDGNTDAMHKVCLDKSFFKSIRLDLIYEKDEIKNRNNRGSSICWVAVFDKVK